MPIEISLLADHPEMIEPLAQAYLAWSPRWYGPGSPGDARADLTARARNGQIPCGFVAIEDGEAVGTCALTDESMSRRGEFGAWLVGLWVAPSHRRRGLAAQLLDAAVREAGSLGIAEVRAGTVSAVSVFERAGWRRLQPILHKGETVQLFSFSLWEKEGPAGRRPVGG